MCSGLLGSAFWDVGEAHLVLWELVPEKNLVLTYLTVILLFSMKISAHLRNSWSPYKAPIDMYACREAYDVSPGQNSLKGDCIGTSDYMGSLRATRFYISSFDRSCCARKTVLLPVLHVSSRCLVSVTMSSWGSDMSVFI